MITKHILITGATGLLGSTLIPTLQKEGHTVSILTRKPITIKDVKVYLWDIDLQTIDNNALQGVDTIIHLAGAGIADKKWTNKRKKEIIESRVKSAQLLYKTIRKTKAPVTSFISAAAVGYYGNRNDEFLSETCKPGKGFLADCCVRWEAAADEGKLLDIRVVKIRIGLLLSGAGGALTAIAKPIKFFVGAPLGNGKQWIPWIHITDVINIFAKAVNDKSMAGAYHATAPVPVTNKLLVKRIAYQLNRPIWPIHVPAFILRLLLGELSTLVLMSNNTNASQILATGYQFSYPHLDEALEEIYAGI
ncbi:MAG: TIGR01777 family oxidoreductase [Bacteroidota bacterium]